MYLSSHLASIAWWTIPIARLCPGRHPPPLVAQPRLAQFLNFQKTFTRLDTVFVTICGVLMCVAIWGFLLIRVSEQKFHF
jgi:hypothetical protein